ncbi:hypothetical protein ACJMK2_013016 [Sinanodonta woodiana]|uniref:G-protein coupled receptors family 1 profile domain-containing protein n=1 Tax=Sinanodonta woodiana TaxID=1069815 RepID=A0ABD3VA10_SINWO
MDLRALDDKDRNLYVSPMENMSTNVSTFNSDNQFSEFERLQRDKVLQNIGGIIFVSLLMILGLGGNSVAVFVYLRKYKQSSYRTFIVSLEIVDFVTCCAPMMIVVLGLSYPINFFSSWTCKMSAFLIYSMCIGSWAILVTIAGERYRKICVPHGMQLSARMSKYICIFDIFLGIGFASPAAILYGNKSVTINGQKNSVGAECDVSDKFADTNYPLIYNSILLFLAFATVIVFWSIYALIVKQIFRMKKNISRKNPQNISQDDLVITESSPSHSSLRDEESKEEIVQNICDNRYNISDISCKANGQETRSVENKGKQSVLSEGDHNHKDNESKHKRTVAITRAFFLITVVYFCSLFPHLALHVYTFIDKKFIPNLSPEGTVAYQIFRWTFFINNMANPIIYTVYDRKLMGEIRILVRSCIGRCLKLQPKTRWECNLEKSLYFKKMHTKSNIASEK